MAIYLGLDIGSNSVGSAWVDTEASEIVFGVSIFPAGVDETDTKRGAPKNQKRRQSRSQRRSIRRRATRKRRLRQTLVAAGLLPCDPDEIRDLFTYNKWPLRDPLPEGFMQTPWHLRREGLARPLHPYEFGRILVHLNQRRGAIGIELPTDDTEREKDERAKEAEKVKGAMTRLQEKMRERDAKTFGQFMANLYDERKRKIEHKDKAQKQPDTYFREPIRNLRDAFEFHADRALIRAEFEELWKSQASRDSELSKLLSDELKRQLDNPTEDSTWRHQGVVFGQRRTYWDTGTLGRCDLEPTDRCCPRADMYAQEFRVLETVNNIRIEERDQSPRPLRGDERDKVFDVLRRQKTASIPTIRRALGIHRKQVKAFYTLNIERDLDRKINTDWFYLEIVHGVFTEDAWRKLTDRQRDSVNRAILKFDPDNEGHTSRLRQGAQQWWGLSSDQVEKLISAWQGRPKLERRLNLSQRALKNLIPYMNHFDNDNQRWPTQIEARQHYADDPTNGATDKQRRRYQLGVNVLSRADRHFLQKHPNLLPPAPTLSNPVVRKAIHEVRRHLNEYLRRFGRKPDRVVVELARDARQPAKVRNKQLAANRRREAERREIEQDLKDWGIPESNWPAAIRRIRLRREQNGVCPFSIEGTHGDRTITERMAAEGTEVEVEHIVPKSRSGPTMDFNNIVLCFRDRNRNKSEQTPLEWLGVDKLELVLQRIEKTGVRKNKVKWDNLQRQSPTMDEFLNSQLTDTAYASRQIIAYLRDTLYAGEPEDKRHVFTTKGGYTAILRRDWGIVESELDRQWRRSMQPSPETKPGESGTARRDKKDRSDHLHHAIDAVCIAFATGKTIQDIAHFAEEQEKAKAELGYWPKRKPLDPPWGTKDEFRSQVLNTVSNLVVSHRPEKRRIIGALHLETAYGCATEFPGLYSFRMSVQGLKPSNLKPPKKTVAKNGQISWSIEGKGQGSVVGDPALRDEIRICLESNGKDPDHFAEKDMKELTDPSNYKLKMRSGVPIRTVTMLRTLSNPICIVGSDGVERFYVSGNNHHMEILENSAGNWSGYCWSMYHVTRRIRPPKGKPRLPMVIGRKLSELQQNGYLANALLEHYGDEKFAKLYTEKRFIMSLAMGETVYMKHKDTGEPGFFVVFKLDSRSIFFKPHWDAREAKGKGVENPREEIKLSPAQLKDLGVKEGEPPYKVRVSPLGVVTPNYND